MSRLQLYCISIKHALQQAETELQEVFKSSSGYQKELNTHKVNRDLVVSVGCEPHTGNLNLYQNY
jgi:hypothetical protein